VFGRPTKQTKPEWNSVMPARRVSRPRQQAGQPPWFIS
jgi:hypothetical protein